MNSLWQQFSGLLHETQELRQFMVDVLSDDDLAYQPSERSLTLGALCREMGEVERSYIDGFKTFKQNFDYRHPDAGVTTSVEKLKAWYAELDRELEAALQGLSEDDLQKPIDRGYGFTPGVTMNFHIYREALLIFYGKAHVYLKALNKRLPERWHWWVGDLIDTSAST